VSITITKYHNFSFFLYYSIIFLLKDDVVITTLTQQTKDNYIVHSRYD